MAHFGFTCLFIVLWVKNQDFAICWRQITYFFQPQIWLIGEAESHFSTEILSELFPPWVYLITIPIWGICFGWLFVKFDNWLNHFPVLGRKVF